MFWKRFCLYTLLLYFVVYPGFGFSAVEDVINSKILDRIDSDEIKESYLLNGDVVFDVMGRTGSSMYIRSDSYVQYAPSNKISLKEGSIEMWVRPEWVKNNQSNTLLSFMWDKSDSYFSISNGWWEPKGINKLYFVLSNKDLINCSAQNGLEIKVWSHLVVTWKGGEKGECAIYINGSKIARHAKKFRDNLIASNKVFIGSDRGTTEIHKRKSDFYIDKLSFYSTILTDKQVSDLYALYFETNNLADAHRWEWLFKSISKNDLAIDGVAENRVIFDESITWATSKEATDEILSKIKAAGFNVYVPCVWHGRGTYYPSKYYEPDERLKKLISNGYDPLRYLIDRAHSMGIEVHPWFTVVRREQNILPRYAGEGVPELAFDIHNTEFRQFIIDLMLEVVERYNVDGINLDYIRSMGVCLSDVCKKDYEKKYGRSILYDKYTSKIPAYRVEQVMQWNKYAITDIVKTFSTRAKALNNKLIISVDAHPVNQDLLFQGQDSIDWANKGYIDIIYNMDYAQKIDIDNARKASYLLKDKNKMIMLLATYDLVDGKYVYRSGEVLEAYVKYMRETGISNGQAFYHYVRLSNEQIQKLGDGVYKNHVKSLWAKPGNDWQIKAE